MNREEVIDSLLEIMIKAPDANSRFYLMEIIVDKCGLSTSEANIIIQYMSENDLIELRSETLGSYVITPKGYYIQKEKGYKEYIKEQNEHESLKNKALIASYKSDIYNQRTRWVAIVAIIISLLSLIAQWLLK